MKGEISMLNVILLDDEENALDLLEVKLVSTGHVKVSSKFMNPIEFLNHLQVLQQAHQLPDAAFVDIEMIEMNGLEVAEKVRDLYKEVEVVFVTAYSEYAIQAFEVHSLDYILKPTNTKRITKTIDRLLYSKGHKISAYKTGNLYIQSFGEFTVYHNNRKERLKWRTSKVKELCAYLLHDYNRVIGTEELIDRLFSKVDYEKARTYFYTSMSYLRKMFKEIGYSHAIKKQDYGYQLDISGMNWDRLEIENALMLSSVVTDENVESLLRILDLYKGDYFQNFDQIIFIAKRQEIRQNVIHIFRSLKNYYQRKNNPDKILECLLKIVQVAPESEIDVFDLIKMYESQGNRANALYWFENLKQYLKKEFGIEPSNEIKEFVYRVKE